VKVGIMAGNKKNSSHDEADIIRNLQMPFQDMTGEVEIFSKIIEFFPYPIQVYSPDGTSVMVNKAMLEEFEVPDKGMIVGRYNIFKDKDVNNLGLIDAVKRAFKGETISLTDLQVPLKSIRECYDTGVNDIDAMYQDATLFPICGSNGEILYVVVILLTRRIYRGKESIIKAREYIENNWAEEFSIEKIAKAVNLSPYHFSRIFKKDLGVTPYNYYLDIKIEKIKEMLSNTNLSISEVFSLCGVNYHGSYARLFKNKVGFTPSQYRKTIKNKQNND
jgi:AraC family transcriptional regulator